MRRNTSASKVAYPAVLGALSLVLVYIGSIAPTGNWGIIAVAGLLPSAAVISVGLQAGFLCWACVHPGLPADPGQVLRAHVRGALRAVSHGQVAD